MKNLAELVELYSCADKDDSTANSSVGGKLNYKSVYFKNSNSFTIKHVFTGIINLLGVLVDDFDSADSDACGGENSSNVDSLKVDIDAGEATQSMNISDNNDIYAGDGSQPITDYNNINNRYLLNSNIPVDSSTSNSNNLFGRTVVNTRFDRNNFVFNNVSSLRFLYESNLYSLFNKGIPGSGRSFSTSYSVKKRNIDIVNTKIFTPSRHIKDPKVNQGNRNNIDNKGRYTNKNYRNKSDKKKENKIKLTSSNRYRDRCQSKASTPTRRPSSDYPKRYPRDLRCCSPRQSRLFGPCCSIGWDLCCRIL